MVHTAMWPVGATLLREPHLSVQGARKEEDESLDILLFLSPKLKEKGLEVLYYFENFLSGIVILQ